MPDSKRFQVSGLRCSAVRLPYPADEATERAFTTSNGVLLLCQNIVKPKPWAAFCFCFSEISTAGMMSFLAPFGLPSEWRTPNSFWFPTWALPLLYTKGLYQLHMSPLGDVLKFWSTKTISSVLARRKTPMRVEMSFLASLGLQPQQYSTTISFGPLQSRPRHFCARWYCCLSKTGNAKGMGFRRLINDVMSHVCFLRVQKLTVFKHMICLFLPPTIAKGSLLGFRKGSDLAQCLLLWRLKQKRGSGDVYIFKISSSLTQVSGRS
ncbi:hypothetical protein P171DRAFT_450027 [Karstenula rhodostoma CBS 690.94]|uniref:Uncharacterized protein n=1 Tax=Karstenula rhodostoma CBS 690.94 TaxID=1392251 RepID=A0A9P4P572_9PLEO|nr:hypothetical protein P171DRAFT_450027 [Karstenula rhodostoma CBS 690.94]